MNSNPIIIVLGEPNSIFTEILFKSFKKYKNKKPILIIGSIKLVKSQLHKLRIKTNKKLFNSTNISLKNLSKKKINIIDINYEFNKPFEKISSKSNSYISKCFNTSFKIIKKNKISGLINGPISKKFFLKGKFQGVTEYLSNYFKIKDKFAMIIYNKHLSVSPITTHLPILKVAKNIKKKSIILKTLIIYDFFKKKLSKSPKIAICGLNPHCENFFYKSEEEKVIIPAINYLKKKNVNISGPFPADTIFIEKMRKNFDVIIGMYHDQVLTPIKSIYEFNAINITLGLPFIRISPDHGPNFRMIGKNKSNPQSLLDALKFLDKLK